MKRIYTLFLLAPLMMAAKAPPEVQPWTITLDAVRESDQTNTLSFDAATLSSIQGHDVYYVVTAPGPGQNAGRIYTGAFSPWNDIEGANRCDGSQYWVYAYDKGRKNYQGPIQGSGDLCGGGPVDPGDPPANVTIDLVSNPIGICSGNASGRLLRDNQGQPLRSDGSAYGSVEVDEFQGVLDANRWHSKQDWSTSVIVNNEDQMYIDVLGADANQPFSPFVKGLDSSGAPQYLVIRPARTADTMISDAVSAGQPYLSGIIRSRDTYTEGYFETYARFAPGTGLWTAFWLYTADYTYDSEYDIEYIGQERSLDVTNPVQNLSYTTYQTIYTASHRLSSGRGKRRLQSEQEWSNSDSNETPEFCGETHDFSKEFHTYGIQVSADSVKYYVDDVLVHATVDPAMLPQGENLYLIFNVALGGSWPGNVTSQTDTAIGNGQVFAAVDWIKIYQ